MKISRDRTKVVVRHLPPAISRSSLVEHIDSAFSGRYRWLSFSPGKFSRKHPTYSRAYISFNKPEDVVEFAKFFNGHVFVNEKGTQFKAIVEYAPSQRVPEQCSKKDGRDGTILKDLEYLEFLEFVEKPVENLPSAEIQLQRKEAERAGAPKAVPVITPLMHYVRQKRAALGEARSRPLQWNSLGNYLVAEDKIVRNGLRAVYMENQERRTRIKDRPGRGIWTPFRRSDGSHASEESSSFSVSQKFQVVDYAQGTRVETKHDRLVAHGGGHRAIGSGRSSYYSVDNGSFRQGSRRGSAYNVKNAGGSSIIEGKPFKRGGSAWYGSNEKQVWVPKSFSAT